MSNEIHHILASYASAGTVLRTQFFEREQENLLYAAMTLAQRLRRGGKLLLCGNGGSAADAQHLAAEFVNRFLLERRPLPALALSTDTSILTAIGNDRGFAELFAIQTRAHGRPEDVLIGISTSGKSPNVLRALSVAREIGMFTLGLTGQNSEDMAPLCDLLLTVPHTLTPLIQEIHIAAGHILCQLTEYYLFEKSEALPQENHS